MTHYGDLCASEHCADLASPGHTLCSGCIADRQAERAAVAREATERTEAHEAEVAAQEPTN